jgi:acyl-CoA thioester hydrolase
MLVPMTDNSDITAPLSLHTGQVLPDWIDYNGHMNLAYYMLAFDHATDFSTLSGWV